MGSPSYLITTFLHGLKQFLGALYFTAHQ